MRDIKRLVRVLLNGHDGQLFAAIELFDHVESGFDHGGVSDFMFLQIKNDQLAPVSDFIKASQVWS